MHFTEDTKKYAAFISYRHVEPDMTIAKKLHEMLEHNQVRPNRHAPRNIRPVFLDTGELPIQESLDASILHALDNSECLFVICSPDLPKSKYCMREIEYFKNIHGGRVYKIYTLLVRGTPEESFPDMLRTELRVEQGENGAQTYVEHDIEPLFADIRATSLKQSMKKLRKSEFLRLAAAYYGCSYDSLYKRRRRWQIRVAACFIAALLAVAAAFGVYAHVRNLQYDAARAATYASYAEEQAAAGNELLALALCEEGWEAAQKSGSERFMTALRSAVVQNEFNLHARPVRRTLLVESESTAEPLFYLNDDGTLAISMTNHFFQISDTRTGAILQQFPADSIALDPDNVSFYVSVEAVRDANGTYQDTLFLRTPEGGLIGSFAFRPSSIRTPSYKMVTMRDTPDLLGLTDNNERIVQFTRQGVMLTDEEAEKMAEQPAESADEEEAPFYVTAASVMSRSMQVKDRNKQTVLDLETKQAPYCFTSDYGLFGYEQDGVMRIFETESWTQVGEVTMPEGLLQKVHLLEDTGYALCIYRTVDFWYESVLIDWRNQTILMDSCGYAYPDERIDAYYCTEPGQIAKYSYRDMDSATEAEVSAMAGNRILSRQDKKVFMMDADTGRIIWADELDWSVKERFSEDLTRVLIPGMNRLRCRDEAGRILWETGTGSACSALSADGKLAAYIAENGDLQVVNAADGSAVYAVPAAEFGGIGHPTGLMVSERGAAVMDGERSFWIEADGKTVCELGAYTDASEAAGYLILSNSYAYVMDFAVWDSRTRSVLWQPGENTGLWDWSEKSGYLVRHKQISGNRDVSELAVCRLTEGGIEEIGTLPLPERSVSSLRLDGTGRMLSVRAGDIALVYDLEVMEKKLETTGCPVFFEEGRLWDWFTYDGGVFTTPMLDGGGLHDAAISALTSGHGVRTLSQDEKNRYSFTE